MPDDMQTKRSTEPADIAVQTDSPGAVREEIQRTRARMSDTIDEIEDALLRRKEEIEARLDVSAPIRERPLPALGIALGAGFVLGFLTGGDDEDEDDRRPRRYRSDADERAEMWEHRAHRLLRIAQDQEDELQSLRGSGGREIEWRSELDDEDESGTSRLDELKDMLLDRFSGYVGTMIRDVMSRA